jgi:hypothetical protein
MYRLAVMPDNGHVSLDEGIGKIEIESANLFS